MTRPARKHPGRPFSRLSVTSFFPLAREFQGISYSLLVAPGNEQAQFSFSGSFQGREMVWDTTLLTLLRYHAEQPDTGQSVVRSAFMEIGDTAANGRVTIRVALDIPAVDEATILRTIIMIRNYKRLHVGRHEFGEPRVFPPHTAG